MVFALLGAIWKDGGNFPQKGCLGAALVCWGLGLSFAAIAAALGYKSQHAFLKSRHRELDAEHAWDANDQEKVAQQRSEKKIEGDRGKERRGQAERSGMISLALFLVGMLLEFGALLGSLPG